MCVRWGEGVFELAAKGSAPHLGGAIAALVGCAAVPLIGLSCKNLRRFVVCPILLNGYARMLLEKGRSVGSFRGTRFAVAQRNRPARFPVEGNA
jgi:hypothetical protein